MEKGELEKLKDPIYVNFNLLKSLNELKLLLKNSNEILALNYNLLKLIYESNIKNPKEDKEGVLWTVRTQP